MKYKIRNLIIIALILISILMICASSCSNNNGNFYRVQIDSTKSNQIDYTTEMSQKIYSDEWTYVNAVDNISEDGSERTITINFKSK